MASSPTPPHLDSHQVRHYVDLWASLARHHREHAAAPWFEQCARLTVFDMPRDREPLSGAVIKCRYNIALLDFYGARHP